MTDPFEALRLPTTRVDPDPGFAAALRDRLVARLLEVPMTTGTNPRARNDTVRARNDTVRARNDTVRARNDTVRARNDTVRARNDTVRARNGSKQGDIAYITLNVPDLERAKTFYGSVLGWTYDAGNVEAGAQVRDTIPMLGLWGGGQMGQGAVLSYRVDDIRAAGARVRAAGGTCSEPRREHYGMTADGVDPDGLPFWLHDVTADGEMGDDGAAAPENGLVEGDVSYVSLVVPSPERSSAFYRAVTQGGIAAPTIGLSKTGASDVALQQGAVLCYRVDDARAAADRVTAAGGRVVSVDQRAYALEVLAVDDQGTDFYLHQF